MRKGAHTGKRVREDAAPTNVFEDARMHLHLALSQYVFVKVVEVTHLPPSAGKPEFFHGVGLVVTHSRNRAPSVRDGVFFDKGGRLRHNAQLNIGPCNLFDAAWGRDHVSARPQVGDILVGVLCENTRPKAQISKVLRSWSRNGHILQEVSRITEFGTRLSDFEMKTRLWQSEAALAKKVRPGCDSKGADDFCMLVRIILWGSMRGLAVRHFLESGQLLLKEMSETEKALGSTLCLSVTAKDFVHGLASKFSDVSLIDAFSAEFQRNPFSEEPKATIENVYNKPLEWSFASVSQYPQRLGYGMDHNVDSGGGKTPEYAPSSPISPPSPAHAPSSPISPPSPRYAPSSPISPSSPAYAPSSPAYAPSSPISPPSACIPSSPPAPSSPAFAPPNSHVVSYEEI